MKDKFVLLMAILNIVVLTFLFAYIADKNSNKKPIVPEPEPIKEDVKGSKSCDLNVQTGNDRVINTNHVNIEYTNEFVTSYSITYNLAYDGNRNARTAFDNYKNGYNSIVTTYQDDENYEISDYLIEDTEYRVTITHNISENDTRSLLFRYNQNIDEAISYLTNQGYTCE